MLGIPPLNEALRAFLAMADAQAKTNAGERHVPPGDEGPRYPPTWGAALMPAFDVVSNTFRSLPPGARWTCSGSRTRCSRRST